MMDTVSNMTCLNEAATLINVNMNTVFELKTKNRSVVDNKVNIRLLL